ncbi:Threonyl-tRNA synthetase [Candidatus Phytoplasma australiense]|uniref:Threonine--tRNA ligase n=1 Tax=Phytoplasma australiense TaxID=59748 RepID=SYT_PHYAS|nr:RecName: Full=Threonine--tRNA ligase; AltName: Full=Threonyl-tRNA synthetase; Short=ThrRS [Candidatus Phytoplasma australiense]CAM11353.1 Threonyl-tRNA synthetase [Candidatus Phytoplasma australiense]
MIKINLLNHQSHSFPSKTTPLEIWKNWLKKTLKKPVAALFNQKFIELDYPLTQDGDLEILAESNPKSLFVLNHSTAHLMAQAIQRLYPNALFTIGPAIKEGFYYDIDFQNHSISEKDLPTIEKKMHEVALENHSMIMKKVTHDEAKRLFSYNPYKLILLEKHKEEDITVCHQGEFIDLCRGGHIPKLSLIKHFKLLKISGSYFQGDAKNKSLTRIYGTSFFKKEDLGNYLKLLEERKERDHKRLNKKLDLFMFSQEVGLGLPFWLPKGATLRRIVERYIVDKELSHQYHHVYTPIMANVELYRTSGHLEHYSQNMFPVMQLENKEKIVLRPMNCPHHMMIYKKSPRSYKELPLRIAELGMMHRFEKSGAVSGLQRVREMNLNDAHNFVRPDQIEEEIKKIINLILEVYRDFKITKYEFRLSYRDPQDKEKYFPDDNMWQHAENILKKTIQELNLPFREAIGDAAFYGPKLDVQVLTALGNEETLSTIQLDFLLPQKFDLTFIDANNKHCRPVVIHRAIVSTLERFLSHLIEENKGVFPLWLAPVQILLIPVSSSVNLKYTQEIKELLLSQGLRAEINSKEATLGYKIREAQELKIPYQIVVGDNEIAKNLITFRKYGQKNQTTTNIETFISSLNQEIMEKR